MSSADEIFEKLLLLYEGEGYTSPKQVLHYHIIELMREGRTREEAIITLYEEKAKLATGEAAKLREAIKKKKAEEEKKEAIREKKEAIRKKKAEEAIKRQIHEYERNIEELSTRFSKAEISEESYRTAVKVLEKKIDKLKEGREGVALPIRRPEVIRTRTNYKPQERDSTGTASLYCLIVGFFFLLAGLGCIFYVRSTTLGWITVYDNPYQSLGIVILLIGIVIMGLGIALRYRSWPSTIS